MTEHTVKGGAGEVMPDPIKKGDDVNHPRAPERPCRIDNLGNPARETDRGGPDSLSDGDFGGGGVGDGSWENF